MGTAQHENHTTALGFSRADISTLDSARAAELYGNNIPISRQTVFRESKPYKEKTTLPRANADVSEFVCVTALASEEAISVSEFGNINDTMADAECGCLFAVQLNAHDELIVLLSEQRKSLNNEVRFAIISLFERLQTQNNKLAAENARLKD